MKWGAKYIYLGRKTLKLMPHEMIRNRKKRNDMNRTEHIL